MIGKEFKHYRIEALLGRGGMGEVYRARDTKLDRPVALKVLRPELTLDPERRQRFLQEARTAASIVHPAIAQIYDVDQADGAIFIAMEYVEGETVGRLIARKELDVIAAVEIALQVCEGLGRAHKSDIVHRDIKSDNIMVTKDGHAKLLDFGLAKAIGLAEHGPGGPVPDIRTTATLLQTLPGVVVGTIAYMSPEQARGQDVRQTSDVFSMGVVLYEMVAGELPFLRDTPLDTMHSIAYDEARPVITIRRNLPPQIHRIITRCLRKRPEDRYPDAQALAADLRRLKQELDTGIVRGLSPMDRLRSAIDRAGAAVRTGPVAITVIVLALGILAVLTFAKIPWGLAFWFVMSALLVYRWVKNRKSRMLRKFVARLAKYPEVRAILRTGDDVSVIVERAPARLLLRVNDLVERVNARLFFGKPVQAGIRDDLPEDEFQRLLRLPGILYVRQDVSLSRLPECAAPEDPKAPPKT